MRDKRLKTNILDKRFTLHASRFKARGFTLVETLVAVFILTLSIAAPMFLASRSLFDATVAREQITASYLAQEAIEIVRNIRDQNILDPASINWLGTLPINTDFTVDHINAWPPTISNCSGTCPPIKYDSTTHLYQYLTGTDTNFVRTIRIIGIDNPVNPQIEVSVSVTVSWNVGNVVRNFTLRENIFNLK